MARLLSPPLGLFTTEIEPLAGPRTIGASAGQAVSGFVQTTASPFGLWRWRFSFPPMRGPLFRAYRGWLTALHGGANATRWHFFDPDMLTPQQSGLAAPAAAWWTDGGHAQDWSNGEGWSSGMGWGWSPPQVPLAAAVALDGSIVTLSDQFWGHSLTGGEEIGFTPLYFGMHTVTEVLEPGTYRIWPSVRKAFTTADSATLDPTLALRLESEDGGSAARGLVAAEGLSITMVEVPDYDVRDYFTD